MIRSPYPHPPPPPPLVRTGPRIPPVNCVCSVNRSLVTCVYTHACTCVRVPVTCVHVCTSACVGPNRSSRPHHLNTVTPNRPTNVTRPPEDTSSFGPYFLPCWKAELLSRPVIWDVWILPTGYRKHGTLQDFLRLFNTNHKQSCRIDVTGMKSLKVGLRGGSI